MSVNLVYHEQPLSAKKHLLDRNESCAVFVRNISLVVCHNYEDLPVSTSISALCLAEQCTRHMASIPALFHTYQVLVYIKNSMWRVKCMGSSWYYDDDVGRFRSVIPDYPMTTPYTSQNLGLRNASLKMSGAEGVNEMLNFSWLFLNRCYECSYI